MPQSWLYKRFNQFLERHLPEGLFARSLIILVAPVVLLQTIMTGLILDRHFEEVTRLLARSFARDVGLLIQIYEDSDRSAVSVQRIEHMANEVLALGLTIEKDSSLPAPLPAPLYSRVDQRLTRELRIETGKPFWIDSSGQPGFIDVRVELENAVVFRLLTREERALATSTDVLLLWMLISSLLLLGIAIIFLRNQIRPITDLAKAAQSFGTGRDAGNFRPRGAREVRQAGEAFVDMRDRIARQVEQRTTMLAGVSHDLRTPLSRLKLELALAPKDYDTAAAKTDILEMERMLDGYLAFARGEEGEQPILSDLASVTREAVAAAAARSQLAFIATAPVPMRLRQLALKRAIANLANNAADYGSKVSVTVSATANEASVVVEDDGPGIPSENYEDAFRPFSRLDASRNQNVSGVGLGLTIARDTARAHGGDVTLGKSELGGLRATIRLPLDTERPKGLGDEED